MDYPSSLYITCFDLELDVVWRQGPEVTSASLTDTIFSTQAWWFFTLQKETCFRLSYRTVGSNYTDVFFSILVIFVITGYHLECNIKDEKN